jgi:hypothetical protein
MEIRTLIFVGLLGISAQGSAAYFKGGELLKLCESESFTEKNYCRMYLSGVVDAHEMLADWDGMPKKYFCTPNGVSLGQLRRIYIKYANEMARDWHKGAGGMVISAFWRAFPCE